MIHSKPERYDDLIIEMDEQISTADGDKSYKNLDQKCLKCGFC